jgi:hypothetical protein
MSFSPPFVGFVLLMFSTLLWCLENLAQMQSLGANPLIGMLGYLQVAEGRSLRKNHTLIECDGTTALRPRTSD